MKRNIFIMMLVASLLLTACLPGRANNEIADHTTSETTAPYEETTECAETETAANQETEQSIVVETTEPTDVATEPTETEPEPADITYPIVYSDSTCKITITKEWHYNTWCYIAHLEFSDYDRFGTACANGAYGNGYETTSNAAKRLGAIFAVNGDYSSSDANNSTVRDGVVYRGYTVYGGGVYNSNTGIFTSPSAAGVAGRPFSETVPSQFTDYLSFWANTLVRDGQIVNNSSGSRAQRTFIGTNGNAGDIWIVVSDGRYVDGESAGLTSYEEAQLMLDLGCTFAIGLDGGGSSTMVWNGEVLNSAKNSERAVVDFVYFK